jgi:hypothetical protein
MIAEYIDSEKTDESGYVLFDGQRTVPGTEASPLPSEINIFLDDVQQNGCLYADDVQGVVHVYDFPGQTVVLLEKDSPDEEPPLLPPLVSKEGKVRIVIPGLYETPAN